MQTEAKVARGAAALYVASIFSLLLNTAYFVILTNFISVDEVGLVSLLNVLVIGTSTLATLALPLVGSGITATPPAVTRFLSQYIQTGEGSARKLYFLSAGICAAASSAAAVLLSNPSIAASLAAPLSPKPFVYASLDAVAYSFSQLGIYSLVGGGRAPLAGKLLIASSALRYAVASLLLFLGYAVSGVFIGFSIGDFFLAAISTSLAAKMVFASKEAPFRVRPVAAYMVSVMVAAFAGFGVTQVDKLLAFFQQGLGNLGVYNVATVGAAIASFAPSAVTNVLVPTLGSLRPGEGGRRRELMRNYTRYIIFIAAPMGAGLAAVSPFLLQLFGREYLVAAPLLAVISLSVAFTSVGAVYSSDLLVGERIYLFSVANIVGLVTLVSLSLVLVPRFGLLGIAIARGAMLVLAMTTLAYFVRGQGDLVLDGRGYLKSSVASAVMGVVVYGFLDALTALLPLGRSATVLASLVSIPLGFVLYLILMKYLGGFGPSDLEFLRELLPRRMSWVVELAKKLL